MFYETFEDFKYILCYAKLLWQQDLQVSHTKMWQHSKKIPLSFYAALNSYFLEVMQEFFFEIETQNSLTNH